MLYMLHPLCHCQYTCLYCLKTSMTHVAQLCVCNILKTYVYVEIRRISQLSYFLNPAASTHLHLSECCQYRSVVVCNRFSVPAIPFKQACSFHFHHTLKTITKKRFKKKSKQKPLFMLLSWCHAASHNYNTFMTLNLINEKERQKTKLITG